MLGLPSATAASTISNSSVLLSRDGEQHRRKHPDRYVEMFEKSVFFVLFFFFCYDTKSFWDRWPVLHSRLARCELHKVDNFIISSEQNRTNATVNLEL